jgi:arginyl-tRNA synthetase
MSAIEALLTERLTAAFTAVAGTPTDPVVRASAHADFQADGALAVARTLGRPPRAVATDVLAAADLAGIASAEVSGPGFINLTVDDALLTRLVAQRAADPRLGVARTATPQRVVVDYSGPNAAKEMHVGHLRSTIIGDAVVRLLEWLGHTVIRRNHIGEWGTPFGMLIEYMLDQGVAGTTERLAVGDLTAFYQAARLAFDSAPEFAERSRARVVALQSGDPESMRLWRLLVEVSKQYFDGVYQQLDVRLTPADYVGESSYHDQLAPLLAELDALGLVRISDGSAVVYPAGFAGRDGQPLPLIVRKRDGGFGYVATDLAALRHRLCELHADQVIYVVGLPQQQYFEMIFAIATAAGWLPAPGSVRYVGHGSVLGPDGKLLRTRAGSSVKLGRLLDEAVAHAGAVVAAKNPDLGEGERAALAHAVGVGAVKYADLSADRTRDYVFDLDRMLSLDDGAPYLQYAHVRTRSILARAGGSPGPDVALLLAERAERVLALRLLAFEAVIAEVSGSLRFHRLVQYLRGLAEAFTTFFERCPVLRAEPALRDSRLVLCELTGRTLRTGLELLGIQAPERL